MPITKSTAVKVPKKKLSPSERSQIAKDRWANIRAARAAKAEKVEALEAPSQPEPQQPPPTSPDQPTIPQNPEPEQPPATPESIANIPEFGSEAEEAAWWDSHQPQLLAMFKKAAKDGTLGRGTLAKKEESPALPQVIPPVVKKQKRTPVAKEFLLALKMADQKLAKAIEEYEDCDARIEHLKKAIPRLQRTVMALRSESNPDAPVQPYDFSVPNATSFQVPVPQHNNPLAAIQAAMDAAQAGMPVSKARGGVQLAPDVVGSLEGPEDDDIDRFITGAGEQGWVGG